MNDKVINIGAKVVMILIIVGGVILSGIIMSYGNPKGYTDKDIYALGKEVAIKEGKNKEYDQQKLDDFITETGTKIKNDMMEEQDGHVFTAIIFTRVVLILAVVLIAVALIIGLIGEPKKYIKGLAGVVGLGILIFIIWQTSTDVLPDTLVAKNNDLLAEGKEPIYDAEGMKLAGGAITSAIVLIFIAVAAWIGSAVYKVVKS
ncbi:hypothetical protein [Parvicella tangerina]|uniref:Uncharacterized protein n=1 Tax=Parvicella tangerina TaxID=2829795 RepID=A0A916NJ13_9FLAO|nr:hypothetical protein [Parvicella tangerina]CAG5086105.1 hypothetical protein CRYO30217_03009 [Parvicella tangerina]